MQQRRKREIVYPPVPWDESTWPRSDSGVATQSANNLQTTTGFYRVINVSPVARPDIVGVEQDSLENPINVLANDRDLEHAVLSVSDFTMPANGSVQHAPGASMLLYTPASGFYGQDSFTYSAANPSGAASTANVTVFVNQFGNQRPVTQGETFILEPFTYTVIFDAVGATVDPDGDPLSLYTVTPPRFGAIETSGSGVITYTRNPTLFGRDSFTYVVVDNRGGHAVGEVIILQQDTDGDGMPDEWEILHGLNPELDDAHEDPDGDGLPNLAEFKLGTNPNVPDNPLNLENMMENQEFAQMARIPLPLNLAIERPAMSLLLNGNPANASVTRGLDRRWYMDWDTRWMENGSYSIALSFQYFPGAQPPATSRVSGQTRSVLVNNEVTFGQWTSEFDHTVVLDLTFAYQEADFRVELYDENGDPLVYLESSTTDGTALVPWDLTYGGQQIAFSHVRADVFVVPSGDGLLASGGGSFPPPFDPNSEPSGQMWFVKRTPGTGNTFVVAWGWHRYLPHFNNQREQMMLNGVINIIGNPANPDAYSLAPIHNVPFTSAFRYDTAHDKDMLFEALALSGSRNFFWLGHGTEDVFYGNHERSNTVADEVEHLLQNKKHRSTPRIAFENENPYRLVILNGCEMYHQDWAHAFGFDFSPGGSDDLVVEYQFTGRKAQAFVAWTGQVEIPSHVDAGGVAHMRYASALGELFSRWMGGWPLNICLEFYADTALNFGFENADTWRISGCKDLTRFTP